jgi:adenosylhomocysteine nucleosidase
MRTGIVAATFWEARPLLKGLAPAAANVHKKNRKRVPRRRAGELIFLPEGAMLLVSGMGAVRAGLGARRLLENGATALVSWGFAGGLLPNLSPGTLILPEKIHAADHSVYFADPAWLNQLQMGLRGQVELREGALAESAGIVASRAEKELLLRRTASVAVDMESGALARAAMESRVPFLAVRAITDSADTDLPRCALDAADEFGRVRAVTLFMGLCRRPAEIFALARMLRGVRAAEATLAGVVVRARSYLLRPPALDSNGSQTGPIFPAAARGEIS